jgi:tetratricopeptide (TPR) repeat protein
MTDEGNDGYQLINAAIKASIEFEELMDKTDFDSWLEDDNSDKLRPKQELTPFNEFKKNKIKLKDICDRMKQMGAAKSPKSGGKSSLERCIISKLFDAKIKRRDARICPNEREEKKEYNTALHILLSALNALQNPERDNMDKRWSILLYNDLSICYAGLKNSSMSRGYAEEARKIIKEEGSYKGFDQKFSTDNSTNMADIANHKFVSSKFYELYTVTLFNQALAERRSSLYTEAERNFKKIIKYAEEDTHLRNFNYYSALLNLSDLYMDQGRGKEAIEFLKRVKKLDEDDIRYWNAYLAEITALIDQSKYDTAEKLLIDNFSKEKSDFTLSERHMVTSSGFKALNHFARCKIEKVRNTLTRPEKDEKSELKKAKRIIKDNIKTIKDRKQEGFETKAYKQLSDIYELLEDKKGNVIKCLTLFISETKIKNLDDFIISPKMDYWIDKCDDLNALESFTDQIIKVTTDELIDTYRDLLEKLKEKIKRECEDKDQLSRAERRVTKIDEVVRDEKRIKYEKDTIDNLFGNKKKGLTAEEIINRLDINEKEFDSVLFKRSEMKKPEHIVAEVIVLRRWNSFSPGLYRESIGSLGGGYLLRINKGLLLQTKNDEEKIENIVIDPGYNFLQNFRSEGFCIEDIDTIIVTHSHLDHCAELLPIMDLIFQFNKRYYKKKERKKKRVSLCLSKGAYKKFSGYTNDPDWQKQLKDVIILEDLPEKKWIPFKGLMISAIPTPHMDLGGVNAIGLMIEIDGIVGENEENSKTVRLGFTGSMRSSWKYKVPRDWL